MGNNTRLEGTNSGWYGHEVHRRDGFGSSGFVLVPAGMCVGILQADRGCSFLRRAGLFLSEQL